ncbi:hypothetical protein IQ266_22270 [filamentous cyanobacterium LEGE 11480]|uniref:Permuted papain-like amidase YaeF/Yiix C92 family enzyme n=1 Tax=Romeriopsis navalis LEGE 11480 TaxID=2777977 RepID=A0A928VTW6_9CYAN|nr:hypothetical protein [Romeriopsis navalis]MBE9032467.1 hypothetical protein [Romeriopsis navalis LEGE 11480]
MPNKLVDEDTYMLIDKAYADMRSQVKPGDIFAFSGSDLPSQVVKLATRSQYVHVAIVVWVDSRVARNNAILIAESHVDTSLPSVGTGEHGLGVQLQWLNDRVETQPGPIWWIPLAESISEDGIIKMRRWLQMTEAEQTPYDFKQAIAIGLVALGWDGLSQADDEAFFCSELVAKALQVAGVLEPEINPACHSPADVIDLPCFNAPILLKSTAGTTV